MGSPKGDEPNAFELANRVSKATRILASMDEDAITADEARHFNETDWKFYSMIAGVRFPSPKTQEVILYVLRDRTERNAA